MAKGKPKVGSRAWDKSLRNNPNFVRETIASVTLRAEESEPGAAELLAQWLAEYPEYRGQIRAVDELNVKAEDGWVKAAGGGNKLAEQAARDEATALRAELLPADATILDRVLVGAVVVAHLSYTHAAMMASGGSAMPAVQAARDRRMSVTQKRFFTAVKDWQLIAGKKARGMRSPLKLLDAKSKLGS